MNHLCVYMHCLCLCICIICVCASKDIRSGQFNYTLRFQSNLMEVKR